MTGVGDRSVEAAIATTVSRLRALEPTADPLFPTAILRGRGMLGRPGDPWPLLDGWESLTVRDTGALRYRWNVNPRYPGPLPAWLGSESAWRAWRPRDAVALSESPQGRGRFLERLLTPIVLADLADFVGALAEGGDAELAALGRRYLDEALPKLRRDAAAWVGESHAWGDTWALWALARRPHALRALHPYALAIGDAYATSARRAGAVCGSRYPFHAEPLVSASAQLASGLVALGIHPKLVGSLSGWIATRRHPDGGWGDADGPSDILTTLVAADLLGAIDPSFDPAPTAGFLARAQGEDGWWRAYGPEATWLSVEVFDWLRRAGEPFARRFRWPNVALANRDRRTGLPFYAYYGDLERLFADQPGLAEASVEVAFFDLAGFGEFNTHNPRGMAGGDAALRAFARALAEIPDAIAIRDGGDEFLVVGAPTATGLPARIAAFRDTWPARFAEAFPGAGQVAPRVLTVAVPGRRLVAARDRLGIAIGKLKEAHTTVGSTGVQVDLGRHDEPTD